MFVSAAPACTNTSVSQFGLAFDALFDFIWVRSYDTGSCSVGQPQFITYITRWVSAMTWANVGTFPKYCLGALSFDNGKTGWTSVATLGSYMLNVSALAGTRWGGMMYWDSTSGLNNIVNGDNLSTRPSATRSTRPAPRWGSRGTTSDATSRTR